MILDKGLSTVGQNCWATSDCSTGLVCDSGNFPPSSGKCCKLLFHLSFFLSKSIYLFVKLYYKLNHVLVILIVHQL